MLMTDVSGLDLTCASPDAVAAWNRTVENFLSHDRDTPASLAQALEADENFALAWCAKGLFTTLLARTELAAPALEALARAERSVRLRGATAREHRYLEALRCATRGSFTGAIAELEAVLDAHPRDSLAAKLSHALRFLLGDARGMRRVDRARRGSRRPRSSPSRLSARLLRIRARGDRGVSGRRAAWTACARAGAARRLGPARHRPCAGDDRQARRRSETPGVPHGLVRTLQQLRRPSLLASRAVSR